MPLRVSFLILGVDLINDAISKRVAFFPVYYRICFKIALLTFKCLHEFASLYLQSLLLRNLQVCIIFVTMIIGCCFNKTVCTVNTGTCKAKSK